MNRSRSHVIAALFLVVLGLFDAVTSTQILAAGSAGAPPIAGAEEMGGPPFWAGIMFLSLAVATFFCAYGVWMGQRWAKIVTLVTRFVLIVFGLGDLVNAFFAANYGLAALSTLYLALSIAVVVLVLRRQPTPSPVTA